MASPEDSLIAIASPPPQFSAGEVAEIVDEQYGICGDLAGLVSERDQNFRLTTADGRRYVIKIANQAESTTVTDFQIRALQHMEALGCPVSVPRIIPALSGATMTRALSASAEHVLRVVSYVPGHPLEEVETDTDLARQLGRCLAHIGIALRDFEHAGDQQVLLWDMRRAADLKPLLVHVPDERLRAEIGSCLDDYCANAAPRLGALRSQVIHNDFNPGNVLVTDGQPVSVAGVIDFGDMIRAPLIIDVAVASAYLRGDDDDVLAPLMSFVSGYDSVTHLEQVELELLYDLVRTRLATTLAILYWRLSARGENDAYTAGSLQGGAGATRFLRAVDAIPRPEFLARLHESCEH